MFFSYWLSSVYFRFNQQKQVKIPARKHRRRSYSSNSAATIKFLNTEKLEERLLLTAELIDYQVDTVVVTDSPVASTPSLSPDQGASTLVANGKNDTTSKIEMGTYEAESVQGRVDLTVNWKATTVGASGNVNSLPANADFIDEWNPVVVEIWVSVTNSPTNGVTAASVDFNFDAQYLLVNTIEYGPGFTENQTGNIDNEAGSITGLGAATSQTDHGADTLVLLARVQLSVKEIPLNADGHYIKPVGNLNFQISNSTLTSYLDDVTVTEGAATNLTLVPALFDINDSGKIDYRDLIQVVSVYNKRTIDSNTDDYIWAADFDRSGRVDYRDLILLVTNYQKAKGSGAFFNYPSNFDEVWQVDTLLSVSDLVVDEDSQTVTLTVTSNQEVGGPFSISYSTIDGTAFSGVDYAATSGVLEFSGNTAGESQVITVQLIDDTLPELTEWFQISLENLTPEENIAFTKKQATIHIQNDDAIVVDEDAGEQVVELNGIATFNENAEVDSVTVTSSDSSLVAVPHVEYIPGSSTATLTFSPEPDANGSTLFNIVVTDDQGNQFTHLIPVTVNPINDVPVAENDFFSIDENSILTSGNVFASNPDLPDQDRDGQGFQVTAVSGGVVGTWFTLESGARLKINSDGTFSYDPDQQYEFLAEDETANDSFTYTITDEAGATDTATVQISINGVNDTPQVSGPISVTYSEDDAESTLDLLTHASDADTSDSLGISNLVWTGDAAAVSLDGTTLTVDPAYYNHLAEGESVELSATYDVVDQHGAAVAQSVTMTFMGKNDAPDFMPAGTPLELNTATPTRQVNLNDFFDDVDDASLTYQVISYSSGLLDYELSGVQLTLTGLAGQGGSGTVVIEARDADGLTVTGEITVVVDIDPLEQIEKLQYALVSDQVMDFHGQNTFVLETNVMDASQVTVTSADSEVLSADNVTIESLGDGRLRVFLNHTDSSYGATFLQFNFGERLFGELFLIVLPPAEVTAADAGDPVFELSINETENGGVEIVQVVNTSLISTLLASGNISVEEAFSALRVSGESQFLQAKFLSEYISISTVGSQLEVQGGVNASTGLRMLSDGSNTVSGTGNGGRVLERRMEYSPDFFNKSIEKIMEGAEDWLEDFKRYDVNIYSTQVDDWFNIDRFLNDTYEDFFYRSRLSLRSMAKNASENFNWKRSMANLVGVIEGDDYGQLLSDTLTIGMAEAEITMQGAKMAFHATSIGMATLALETPVGIAISPALVTFIAWNTQGIYASGKDIAETVSEVPLAMSNLYLNPIVQREIVKPAQGAFDDLYEFGWDVKNALDSALTDFIQDTMEASYQFIKGSSESNVYKLHAEYFQNAAISPTVVSNESESMRFEINPEVVSPEYWGELYDDILAKSIEVDDYEESAEPKIPDERAGENIDQDNIIQKNGDEDESKISLISSVQSVYSITQSVQGIVDNIGQIFSSSGGASGEYTDNDGHTYNIYDNQNRSGTDGRDIINTGEGNDHVQSYGGDDRIITSKGNDRIDAGHGRNYVFAAGGEDSITDGNGDSILSAGAGEDVIRPGGGNDLIEGGLGHDVIIYGDPHNSTNSTYDYRDIGNDILIDPTKSGEIHFRSHTFDEITFRKDRYDLEIILPSDDEFHSNTLKFQSFFNLDAAGWEIIDSLGNHYNLYEVTGRITSYETLETVFGERAGNSTPAYPEGIVSLTTMQDSSTRFTMHVASDNRLADERGLVLTFEGDNSIVDWISRNEMASLEVANEMLAEFNQQYQFSDYEHVTLVGMGEGGLIAQWFAAAASTSGVSFVNVQLVNAPDISGLISQVVREEYPEYTAGFPVESTYYLINPNDWVSRIGIWAGNDETYASWKAFSFDFDAQEELPVLMDLAEIQSAHAAVVSTGDFDELTIQAIEISHIRGHMSLMEGKDFTVLYANDEMTIDNHLFDSTTNAWEVFFDTLAEVEEDSEGDPIEASATVRNQFNSFLIHDPAAVDPDSAFSLKLDFQTAAQGTEHTAPDYHAVNETTLFTPEATELLTYGWSQITSGVKAGDNLGRATSLERDFVLVSENTFIIELPAPGTYNISITFGDRENIRESTQVFVNGYASDRVSTMPGDFLTRSYQVNTLDDELRLTFVDRGGQTDFSAINGVTVDQVNYRAILPINEQLDNDPSIVLMTGSYELPESNGFIDTLEDTLKATAMAVATAVIPGIGAGLMSFSTFTTAFSKAVIGTAANATVGSVIANSVGNAVVNTLISSIPKNFISDPTARGILGGAVSIYSSIGGNPYDSDTIAQAWKQKNPLEKLSGGLGAINGSLTATNAIVQAVSGNTDAPPADEWMYEAAASLAQMSQKFRLGRIDAGFAPVSLDEINNAIANGKTGEQLLKLWTGSRDFLVLDWVPEGLELTDVSTSEHKNLVNKSARALKRLIEAYVEKLREGDSESQVDLLLISQGAGYDVHRELVDRLNTSDIEEGLDYVKIVTLDPVSFDEYTGRWVHPEMTSIVDRIDNFFQSEDTPDGDLYHVGRPLDYRIGGGSAGFYNRQARIFDLNTTEELLRFRHWDANEVALSTAELTDIEFNADGSLVAASGKDGIVTVRYVDDEPDPDSETGELLHAAGDVKFIVWGQESKVRSLAFIKMQVDGVWKDFLLTISAANNPDNSDIDKNKVLLTDVETGLPVWQGRDIKGTQVEASPSGNLIVSTDANGRAKIWKRTGDTLTFEKHGDLVEAHPAQDGSYIADIYVINDRYFVTAGLDKRLKLFRITDDGAELVQTEKFDNEFQGKVRNLDYDPYNGILAVASGQELSLWKFDQTAGKLTPLGPEGQSVFQPFARHDHTAAIQGVSFSKPSFLLDEDGQYLGDQLLPGTETELPRTSDGDIDLVKLPEFLESHQLPDSYAGLKLLTGGEDKTLFLYSLDRLDIGDVREESVLSGAMLPIREVTLSPDGSRVAVVGQDNVEDDSGGPVKDIDVTDQLDERLGWKFSEIFLQGRREHNAVPQQYIYDVIEQKGESFFWLRNSSNVNRPGSIDKDRNLALPPNKRDNKPGVDVAPIELYIRPRQAIDVKALHYLLEVDREDYNLDQSSLPLGEVKDQNGIVVGTLRHKMKNGIPLPNVLVFEAFDETQLDYSDPLRNEYTGIFTLTMIGPPDLDGNQVEKTAEVKIRIINHKPTAYADVVELHPNRSEIDYRPKANDYDFDNDDFTLYNFPTTTQVLTYQGEEVATVRKNSGSTNGIDIVVTVTEETLTTLLAQLQASIPEGEPVLDYLSIEFTYQVKEEKYGAISTGTVEVRLQLQAGPENVTYDELGADQVRIQWDPVSWSANKYIMERFDEVANEWVKHASNAEVYGNQSDSLIVKGLTANTDYWFRVVAINTNSARRHASYTGEDKEGGLHVKTPGYVGPGSVAMEVRGAAQMEVNWKKVYWDLNKYIIELRELIVDDNGQLVMDGDAYRYNTETVRIKEVSQGDGLSVLFKRLSPDTPYLAVVTAKKGDESHSTVAEYPVSTLERDLPAGINLERIGPKKIRVSWATVSFAQKYRIVAIDPGQPFLEVGRISQVIDASGGNTNSGVLTGLEPETEYVVIVEAKDKNGNWVSVLSNEYRPTVIPNTPIAENESQIDVSYEGDSEYLLQNDFNNMIRLPSTEGLFVGTTFSIRNLSYHDVQLESFTGETINLYGQLTDKLTLKPALGPNVDPEATGIVVYRFTFLGDSWRVETSDNTSESRTLITPPYLAAEAGTFKKDEFGSQPKRLKIIWESPFWNVEKHRIELYEVLVDSEGQPLFEADGITYQRASTPAANGKTVRLDEANDRFFAYTFTGLKTNSEYIAVLTTTGLNNQKRVVEEIHVTTDDQQSPTGVDYKDVTLSSFTATWTEVKWNVQQYRVSFVEVGANEEVDESTREYRYVNNDKSSKVVDGLKSGVTYQFTVEALTADPDAESEWIANTSQNIKITILAAADLSITGLKLDAARNRQLDLSWTQLSFTPDSLFFEYKPPGSDNWTPAPGGTVNNLTTTTKTLEGLELNTSYDIRLVAMVTDSAGDVHPIHSDKITGSTEWGILGLDSITETKVRVQFLRVASATKYDIFVYIAGESVAYNSDPTIDDGPANPRFTTVEFLKPDTAYEIEVVARDGSTVLGTTQRKAFSTTPMSVVTGLTTANPTDYSVDVSWDPLNWTPDNQYLEVKRSDSNDWGAISRISVGKSQTSITVTDLDNNVSYDFRHVVAVNTETGEVNRKSSIATETTGQAELKLTNVTVTGKRRLFVEWESITYPATRLEIQVLLVDENDNPIDGEVWHEATSGGTIIDVSRTSKEISELIPGTRYHVRVVAFVESFQEPVYSSHLVAVTDTYPVISGLGVSNVKIDGATVEWTRLEALDNDANVTKNVIEVYLDGALVSNSDDTGSGSGTKHSLKIIGLASATQYEFKVVAYNGDVKLSESALYEFSTLFDGVTVDEITAYSARANWPQFAGSSATDYRIRIFELGTDNVVSEKVVNIGTGFRKSTLDGLSPDTQYEMLVEVLKNQSVLSFSNLAVFTTSSAGLSGVSVSDVRRFSMDIEWNSVAEWANWTKVQWRKVGTSSWNGSGSLTESRTAYSITGLQNYTPYEIKVSAGGNGLNYEVTLTKTTADFVKPSAPSFVNVQTRQLTINWTHSDPAGAPDSYAIWRNGEKIGEVGSQVRSFTDNGLTPNTSYSYMIRAKYALENIDGPSASSTTLSVNYVEPTITGISNVRSRKVDVSWSFTGDINEVEKFTIHRYNSSQDRLSLTNPENFPGQTSFTKEIDRNADAKWWIFVRVHFKDGTIKNSLLMQLPES